MRSIKPEYVLVEESESLNTAEFMALQRQSSSKGAARNGDGKGWDRLKRNLTLGLLGLFLFADAVIIGMLANHYLLSR